MSPPPPAFPSGSGSRRRPRRAGPLIRLHSPRRAIPSLYVFPLVSVLVPRRHTFPRRLGPALLLRACRSLEPLAPAQDRLPWLPSRASRRRSPCKRSDQEGKLELQAFVTPRRADDGSDHLSEGAEPPASVARPLLESDAALDRADPCPCSLGAAVCVYPNLVPVAVARLRGSDVKRSPRSHDVSPRAQSPLAVKLADVREAVESAPRDHRLEAVDRPRRLLSAFRYAKAVYDEIVKVDGSLW